MPPGTDIRTLQKRIQLVLSVVLALIVIGLIGGYIYIGMYMAKQSDSPSAVAPGSDTSPEQTPEEQQQAILQALERNSDTSSRVKPEEQEAIVSGLQKNAGKAPSEAEQEAMINTLQQNSN